MRNTRKSPQGSKGTDASTLQQLVETMSDGRGPSP